MGMPFLCARVTLGKGGVVFHVTRVRRLVSRFFISENVTAVCCLAHGDGMHQQPLSAQTHNEMRRTAAYW